MNKARIKELGRKTKQTLKDEGVVSLVKKSVKFVSFRVTKVNRKYDKCFKDILFINGCSLPHPQRYRVTHQMEQLRSYGVSCETVDYDKLNLDSVRFFRGFVFYRCPITPIVEEFIKLAKENNKTVFYDIDDLVFDLEHTKLIKFLDTMSEDERKLYDDGVVRMGKTLDLCEYGIASTKRLQLEMNKHVKETFINRNVASEEMVKYSDLALEEVVKDDNKIIMGYLSGSITHNDDFKLIMPSIIKLMEKYDNLYLEIVGLLDIPKEMEIVKNKVIVSPFVDWKELPKLIRSIDINLAPLENTIFNEAKSENKWTEAALVKIPTIASNIGAFKDTIIDKKTGILCNDNEWFDKLSELINNKEYRDKIGNCAYDEVMNKHITTNSGKALADFIVSKLRRNFCFVLPSTNISGGVMVAVKHGIILKKHGYDVTAININKETSRVSKLYDNGNYLYAVPYKRVEFLANVDTIVATMWLTLKYARKYINCNHIKYLVQSMETGFYKHGEYEKEDANATYNNVCGVEYITISKWCQDWLKKDFGVTSKYAPNGMDMNIFNFKNRDFTGKIKILIEGASKNYYKNVDESFNITNRLDKNKFEIYYLAYDNEPKKWYVYDKFYSRVPHDEISRIYESCDILLKSSILESFSYPPIEMMATGGLNVVAPNGGNLEYLVDGENCLLYELGNYDDAIEKINKLCDDSELRDKLIKNGLETAKSRDWKKIEKDILKIYL
jgi:glycosyltransferase involved in cell wall biosynthesis